ncbi:MAG: hypothetical protein WD512_05910 [Candidatus Paceibacterota bacterium]
MTLLSFSQNVIEVNDTSYIMFDFKTAKEIAKELTEKDYLFDKSIVDEKLISNYKEKIDNLKKQLDGSSSIITSQSEALKNREAYILNQDKIIASYKKKERRRKWRNAGIGATLVGGIITAIIVR